jgi:hypothetical protein
MNRAGRAPTCQHCRMLIEFCVEALIADEGAADEVFDLWEARLISDDLAALAWLLVASTGESNPAKLNRS